MVTTSLIEILKFYENFEIMNFKKNLRETMLEIIIPQYILS
jgi:hypothetical protein